MLGTTRVGLGMLALRRTQGPGAARLRVAAQLIHPQRGLKLFPRFFARMIPQRQQQQTGLTEDKDEKPGQQGHHPKHADTGIVNPVSLPGTGIGMFGFGAGGVDAIVTTLIGITVVFFGGVGYIAWYKANVLDKIEDAFASGYDPALELANHPSRSSMISASENEFHDVTLGVHMERKEQAIVDSIMEGNEGGHYFLFLGPKGSGKSTMMIDAHCGNPWDSLLARPGVRFRTSEQLGSGCLTARLEEAFHMTKTVRTQSKMSPGVPMGL